MTEAVGERDAALAPRVSPTSRRVSPTSRVVAVGALVVLYPLLAWLIDVGGGRSFSPLFVPAGLMFGFLLVAGARWFPLGIVVRVVTARLVFPGDDSLFDTVVQAVIIVTPAAAGAAVLRRRGLTRAHPREFLWFLSVGVVLVPTVAALGLAVRLSIVADQSIGASWSDVRVFWIGDALAIAAITPLLLVLAHGVEHGRQRTRVRMTVWQRTEYAVIVLAVTGAPIASSIFVTRGGPPVAVVLVVLPLLWVALRQDIIEAAIGTSVAVLIVSFALYRSLDFDDLVEVQYLLLCGTVSALFAGAVRRQHEDLVAALGVERRRHRLVDAHAPVAFTELSVNGAVRSRGDDEADSPVHRAVADRWRDVADHVLDGGEPVTFSWSLDGPERRFYDSTAMAVLEPSGALDHVLVVTADRTQLEAASATAERSRTHDPDTGLLNRRSFRERLDDGAVTGVMVVSIDEASERFDEFAPADGPVELRRLADLIATVAGRDWTIARIGEWSLAAAPPAAPTVNVSRALRSSAAALLDARRARAGDTDHPEPTLSIGLVHGDSDGALLGRAERAATAAHELGGDRLLTYHPVLHRSRRREVAVMDGLRRACERDEFVVHYQPIVRLEDEAVVGAEALVRWEHPTDGLVLPDRFIPDAERSGLVVRIDDLICDRVADQLVEWEESGEIDDRFSVSINISPVHLADPDLVARLSGVAERVDARRLRFEVTESAAMRDPEYTVDVLRTLRDLGFTIILDDFGTGYSSMAWLHRLPVQVLKIDRSFVLGLPDDADARRLVELIVSLAADLGISLTAEGIETRAQAELLAELGCRYGQGYLFGRPGPSFTQGG
ncbi:MAG: EAL domain-containing protein [Actinomycetota bacterium]